MPDTVERRKSTRNRGEPPLKLRRTTPAQDVSTTSTPTGRKPGDKRTPGKGTPSRAKPGPKPKVKDSPRPATPDSEPEEPLPEIQESLATMMEKSRQRWLNEGGIFERFWTKPPRKKKGQPAVDMPSKSQMNMIEIGQTSRIIIEPHVFDIHMYGVKKPALSWQPPIAGPPSGTPYNAQPSQQLPMQNPYPRPGTTQTPSAATQSNQRGLAPNPYAMPPSGSPATPAKSPTATTPATTPAAQPKTPASGAGSNSVQKTEEPGSQPKDPSSQDDQQNKTQTQESASVTPASASPGPDPAKAPPAQPQPAAIQAPAPRAQTARPVPPAQQQQHRQQPPAQNTNGQPQQQSAPHPDPVIQMLAQRAAQDPALKELMKVVAAGSTSPEKLKEFQRHIDDINAIVKRQQLANGSQAQKGRAPSGQGNSQQRTNQQQQQQQNQYRAPPFIASKPSAPPPPPRYDFANIAFDFVRGSDCYLLPRSSIVQHLADGVTTLISFIVTRKGKDVPGSNMLKPDVEYYQPMTVTLLTVEQKVRDAINQVVLPKDQVSKEMKEVMERCTLAPSRGMMLEVPEGQDPVGGSREGNRLKRQQEDDDAVRAEWDAPNSLIPLR